MHVERRKSPGTSSLKGSHGGEWSQERIDLLKKYWAEGYSCSKIAGFIGRVSRNAVIGKAARLGLPPRNSRHAHQAPKRTKGMDPTQPMGARRDKVNRLERMLFGAMKHGKWRIGSDHVKWGRCDPIPTPSVSDIPRVTFAGLEPHHCRWPISDASNDEVVGYCGCDHVPGTPYCAHHAQRAYAPPKVASSSVARSPKNYRAWFDVRELGKVSAEDREEVLA